MKKFIYLLVFCGCLSALQAQNSFTLEDVIQRAQSQSPSFKIAETRKENRYWQYRYYKTNYVPQLRLITNSFGSLYTNEFTPLRLDNGSLDYIKVNQLNPAVNFSLQQPIALTGGQIWVNSTYNYISDLISDEKLWNGRPINVFLNQPLFAYN